MVQKSESRVSKTGENMSKFIDRLKQVSQPSTPPMGFGAAKAAAERPKIQLIAFVGNGAVSLVDKLAIVDAVILNSTKKSTAEKLRGSWLKKGDLGELEQAIKVQADFVVLPAAGDVLSSENKIGKILQLDAATTDVMLRAANELPMDAFLLDDGKPAPLTWQRLITLYRFGGLLNKPVIATVPLSINKDEIQIIWDAGISGLVVEVNDEATIADLDKIREIINGLPFPSKKKKDKMSVLLPQVSTLTDTKDDEPDEDDDDDDDDQ
jgi:hypothetical protein